MFGFDVVHKSEHTSARLGLLTTPHGTVQTPAFMPVGTRGAVKGITPEQLQACGAEIVLANTYHLQLRPGAEVVAELGGLHRFMGWSGPILTDSGGYQVFSLAELVEVDDDGVAFRSHIDGARVRLDPAGAVRIQEQLGSDIAMVLDVCPPYPSPRPEVEIAVRRTIDWARRSRQAHRRPDQWLFAIVQGGVYRDLRRTCTEALLEMDFPGYAIGGLSVGEGHEQMVEVLAEVTPTLPADRPRYLMGVGRPRDLVAAVWLGVDLFDCVLPTRNGRNGYVFTAAGPLRLRNACHARSREPIEPDCDCYACRHFSRGYLRHLFQANEMLGPILASIHNLRFFQRFMADVRACIQTDDWSGLQRRYPILGEDLDEGEEQ